MSERKRRSDYGQVQVLEQDVYAFTCEPEVRFTFYTVTLETLTFYTVVLEFCTLVLHQFRFLSLVK